MGHEVGKLWTVTVGENQPAFGDLKGEAIELAGPSGEYASKRTGRCAGAARTLPVRRSP